MLDGISLDIAENRTTAFVGSSGAGKSTLLDLVLGLLEPTAGRRVRRRSIQDDLPSWYADLGVVPQDVFLLNDTLAANIAFGVPATTIDRRASPRSSRPPNSMRRRRPARRTRYRVGERGVRLSGGQRQRIGLARALYRRPRVLVLDEATSALDNATEHEIATTLRSLQGSITILIVAHRLSTVRNADTLVFLKDGRIDEIGSFEHVRATSRLRATRRTRRAQLSTCRAALSMEAVDHDPTRIELVGIRPVAHPPVEAWHDDFRVRVHHSGDIRGPVAERRVGPDDATRPRDRKEVL